MEVILWQTIKQRPIAGLQDNRRGFLCFNFNPATVFLGDGGSLFIGFMLGCFGVIWTQKSVTLIGMTAEFDVPSVLSKMM